MKGQWLGWVIYFCFLLAPCVEGQSEMSLPGMANILQSDLYNPSAFSADGWHLGLPSILYDIYHSGPAFGDLLDKGAGQNILRVENLLEKLTPLEENNGLVNWRLQTIKLKYVGTRWIMGFEHEIVSQSDFAYPTELIAVYVEGNQNLIGQGIEIGPSVRIEQYHSFGLLLGARMDKWVFAVRPKLLTGLKLGYTPNSSAKLYTDDKFYEVQLTTDYEFYNVGVARFGDASLLNIELDDQADFSLFTPNVGFSLDGGITYSPSDRINLGLSFTDLGSISWASGGQSYSSRDTRTYSGLSSIGLFSVEQIDLEGALDSLRSIFDLEELDEDLTLSLPVRFVGTLSFQLTQSLNLALQAQYYERYSDPWAYSAMLSTLLPSGFGVGVSLSSRFSNIQAGLQSSFALGHWMIFVAADNLLQGVNPVNSSQFNFRAGINYHFTRLSLFD